MPISPLNCQRRYRLFNADADAARVSAAKAAETVAIIAFFAFLIIKPPVG